MTVGRDGDGTGAWALAWEAVQSATSTITNAAACPEPGRGARGRPDVMAAVMMRCLRSRPD